MSNLIEYNGWVLEVDANQDPDGFYKHSHFAIKDSKRIELGGSPYLISFDPDYEQFKYLVDHDFPRAPKGNWYSYEIRELIEEEKGYAPTDERPEAILAREDLGLEVLRNGPNDSEAGDD